MKYTQICTRVLIVFVCVRARARERRSQIRAFHLHLARAPQIPFHRSARAPRQLSISSERGIREKCARSLTSARMSTREKSLILLQSRPRQTRRVCVATLKSLNLRQVNIFVRTFLNLVAARHISGIYFELKPLNKKTDETSARQTFAFLPTRIHPSRLGSACDMRR